jgi:predicted acylesterase/phospholipase RssA/CRP-like cAMP-binding protein
MIPNRLEIARLISLLPVLKGISGPALEQFVDQLSLTNLQNESVVLQQSTEPAILMVLSGQVSLSGTAGETVRDLEPHSTVFLNRNPAAHADPVRLTSRGDALVGIITRKALGEIADLNPDSHLTFAGLIHATLERETLHASLNDGKLFGPLTDAFRQALEVALEPTTLYSGELLFHQGEASDSLYIILSGRLRVLPNEKVYEPVPVELGRGETVGEFGLVTGEPRSRSICALRDTYLGRLSSSAYDQLLTRFPQETMRVFVSRVARRVQQISAGTLRASSRIDNIALIPASPGPAFQAFCDQFCEALAVYGSVARVSSARVDAAFGVEGFAQTSDWDGNRIRFIDWLSGLENSHNYVVYEADDRLTPWTERCVRQADRGVIVGNANQDPQPGEIETELIARLPPDATQSKTLVLIQENGNPSGTQRWLDPRKVDQHHHVRLGNREDFARVARFLTGRAVGLTLGGGFARGLAHIGVFRALAECNIPLDAVGGASMGGLIGALWASGWSNERILEEIRTGCRDSFNDMTLPFIAFKSGRKFSDLVARFFGEARIEDLWHPFFCVSANLNRAELTMHKSGGLTKATLASSRAPGIFPPIVYGGELHVDGGSINNVPVDLMRVFCGNGITIGVDVSPPHELEDVEDYGYTVSGLQALRSRFGLWGARKSFMPSIPLILMRTLEFGGISYRMTREGSADLMLQPEMLGFKRTDWHLAEEIVAHSYRHAMEKIEGLNGTLGERIREIRAAQS